MRTGSRAVKLRSEAVAERGFSVDTSFVLFFLAIEFGRTVFSVSLDNIFLFITLLMVAVLPYFLINGEKPTVINWLLGRSLIVSFAVLLGAVFNQSLGIVLPETFRFLPMTLLIVTAIMCSYIQFYGFFKLRVAK